MKKWKAIVLVGLMHVSANSWAALNLGQNLNQADVEKLTHFFGSATTFYQTNGPSALGEVWGLDVGIQASGSQANLLKQVINANGGSTSIPIFPYAYPTIRWGAPWGIGGGVAWMPKLKFSGTTIKTFALAFNWSYGEFFELPFTADVRFHYSYLGFTGQTTSTGPPAVTYDAKMKFSTYGMTASVGKKWDWMLFGVEPYAGIGWHLSDGNYSGSAGTGLLSTGIPLNDYTLPTWHFQAGVDMKFFKYLQLALEYNLIYTVHTFALFFGASI